MTAQIARLPSRPARPTIEVAGKRDPRLEAALISYELSEGIEAMAHAELCFGNWGGEDRYRGSCRSEQRCDVGQFDAHGVFSRLMVPS